MCIVLKTCNIDIYFFFKKKIYLKHQILAVAHMIFVSSCGICVWIP